MIFMDQDYSNLNFGIMFLNSGSNLGNLKTGEEKWKARLMEEELKRRIGEMQNIKNRD